MPLQEITAGYDRPLQEVADLLFRSHKIIVITGAGISTSCGIPDFRSRDGLYNLIPDQNFLPTPPPSNPSTPSRKRKAYTSDDLESPPSSQSSSCSTTSRRSSGFAAKLRGQYLFDASVWSNLHSTATFYRFIASLRQKVYDEGAAPSATHRFLKTLRDGGRLMRNYTQNIDGLESRAGLCMDLCRGRGNKRRFMKKNYEAPLPERTCKTDFDGGCEVVPLHGDLEHLRCTLCQSLCEWTSEATEMFLEGVAPECESCGRKSDAREAKGKRGLSVGSLRPNIVLYGEEHPSNTFLTPLVPFDAASGPEVLIIMGTSLKVYGLQKIVRDFAKAVHSQKEGKGRVIFVNRTRPAESIWDGVIDDYIAMDCDDWVRDLRERRSDLWLRQGDLDLKTTKPVAKRKRKSSEDDCADEPTAKKTKIVIEIPTKLAGKPKMLRRKPQLHDTGIKSAPKATDVRTPATPRSSYRFFKAVTENHPDRSILSPLVRGARPAASPLSHSVKMPVYSNSIRAQNTPAKPPFSPITPKTNTPSRKMSKLWQEMTQSQEQVQRQLEIGNSDHDDDKENAPSGIQGADIDVLDCTRDTTLALSEGYDSPSRGYVRGHEIRPESFAARQSGQLPSDGSTPVNFLHRITSVMGWNN